MTAYERLPAEEGAYPPKKLTAPRKVDRRAILAGLFGTSVAVITLRYALLGVFPRRPTVLQLAPNFASNDTYRRDAFPIQRMQDYLALAEQEIAQQDLDTCGDKLGRSLIEAYHRSRMDYLSPNTGAGTKISCAQVQADSFSEWWPVPASPCISTRLRADDRTYLKYEAELTEAGQELWDKMRRETFVGSKLGDWEGECEENIGRTLLVIPRQDQWNPYVRVAVPADRFHVAEDMITTVVSTLVAARNQPELAGQPVQIVFDDTFGLEGNHFVPMWDRIGAWPPRRLSLDPWNKACCKSAFGHADCSRVRHTQRDRRGFFVVGAALERGVSTVEVSLSRHHCASSITWAASHYYRSLFGLNRPGGVNVLWLSRAKFDRWAMSENKWSAWRDARHISNEAEVVGRLQTGLSAMGAIDHDANPGHWSDATNVIRFATLDPSVHSLDTQVYMVGHASILIGLHGGGLGLSMFLPPGNAVVIEVTVPETAGSRHFETMSAQLGLHYEMVLTQKEVDAEELWRRVEGWVRRYS